MRKLKKIISLFLLMIIFISSMQNIVWGAETLNNQKTGNIKIIKIDSETKEPIENVLFLLFDLSGNVVSSGTTDEKGELYFNNLEVGSYRVQELECPKNYITNTDIYDILVKENETTEKEITNDYQRGNIRIDKTDSYTNNAIKDVTFQLLDLEGNVLDTKTTNAKGIAYFTDVRIGDYQVREILTNPNYILNEETFDAKVKYCESVELNVKSEHKKGNLVINKVDKDNNQEALRGVIFDIFSEEFQEVIGTYETDENGKITVSNLRTGSYTLIEKNTNQLYKPSENTDISISWNNVTEATIESELKKGQIKIIKEDKENEEIKLQNVQFEVLDENDNLLETITTNANGEAFTKEYIIRDYPVLKLREIKTDNRYVLDNEEATIELKKNGITEVTFTNVKKRGQIEITNISADDNKRTGEKRGTPLSGAIFEIYDENEQLVDTITTQDSGKAISKLLQCGTYYIQEKETSTPNYLLNSEKYLVEITQDGQTSSITIENNSNNPPVEKLPKTGF